MPPGSRRGQQRGIGTFDTAEEAGLAVAEAEAKLKEQGPEAVWPEPARTNKHKRGEVRPMPNHHQHSSLTLSTTRICRRHLRSARRRGAGARTPQRSQPSPTYPQRVLRLGRHSTGRLEVRRPTRPSRFGPMPSTMEEVSNKHMAALLATDGSGEVSQAPIPIAE